MALSEAHLNETMGKVLRRFRTDLGMSQSELAVFLGLGSQTVVSNVEKGVRPIQAAEVWMWANKIASLHPLPADDIRSEFYAGPFVQASLSRLDSAPEGSTKGRCLSLIVRPKSLVSANSLAA